MNDFYSDEELKELFGLRPEGIAIFGPSELGWACPVDPSHEITWSEFNGHVWCIVEQRDYFTLLCPRQVNPFTTPEIVEGETEKFAEEMGAWSLERYQNLGKDRVK